MSVQGAEVVLKGWYLGIYSPRLRCNASS